jgi:hypothetical protein
MVMKFRLALVVLLLAALFRLVPHWPNFTPLGAMGLFGAACFSDRRMAWMIPFMALFLSDLVLNNMVYRAYFPTFTWFTSVWAYASLAVVMLMGQVWLRRGISAERVLGASLSGSLLFFLVSNFGVWASGGMYPPNFSGLLLCYAAGLPFFTNTVLGDLFFSGVMFGSYAYLSNRLQVAQTA